MVQYVDEKISETQRANILLAHRVKETQVTKPILTGGRPRKNFKDFEQEMENCEPVEEEKSEDAQSSIPDLVDTVQLPVEAAFGQINYYRSNKGEAERWMQ